MRHVFGGVLLIGALAVTAPVYAQSGTAPLESAPLYEGPIAALATPSPEGEPGRGAATGSQLASARDARQGEPELVFASIDARSFARAGTAVPGDPGSVSRYALRVLEVVNEYRQRAGLAPLRIADDLGSIARSHSVRMAERRRISHDGFRERFDRTNARICVENVGVNFPHPEAQVDGWRASPGHDRNLLEPRVTRVGIANDRNFVTFFACS